MSLRSKFRFFLVLCSSLLIFSACSLPGLPSSKSKDTVSIGTLNTSESQILGGMVKGLIEYYTDLKVNMVNNLATSTMMHQAMLNEDVDISATRYTGTDLSGALQMTPEKDPELALQIVQREFEKQFQQTWYPSYGFANSYAFMVNKETAEKYNLVTISDLAEHGSELTAGVDTSWIDRKGDGYQGFAKEYGIDFKKVYPMQIGLVYDAVNAGKMDIVLGYSTDGRIASYDLVILEDDRQFFPPYDASVVVRDQLLATYPELAEILGKLSGEIDTKTMQALNYEVDDNLIEPEIVAERFLQKHDYFKAKEAKSE